MQSRVPIGAHLWGLWAPAYGIAWQQPDFQRTHLPCLLHCCHELLSFWVCLKEVQQVLCPRRRNILVAARCRLTVNTLPGLHSTHATRCSSSATFVLQGLFPWMAGCCAGKARKVLRTLHGLLPPQLGKVFHATLRLFAASFVPAETHWLLH